MKSTCKAGKKNNNSISFLDSKIAEMQAQLSVDLTTAKKNHRKLERKILWLSCFVKNKTRGQWQQHKTYLEKTIDSLLNNYSRGERAQLLQERRAIALALR